MITRSDTDHIMFEIPELLLSTSLLMRTIPKRSLLKRTSTGGRRFQEMHTTANSAAKGVTWRTIVGPSSVAFAMRRPLDTGLGIAQRNHLDQIPFLWSPPMTMQLNRSDTLAQSYRSKPGTLILKRGWCYNVSFYMTHIAYSSYSLPITLADW